MRTINDVILIYFFLWAGFALGSVALIAYLTATGLRLLLRGARPASVPSDRVAAALVASAALAFAYGAALWAAFDPADVNRGLTVVPPFTFAVLALIAATTIAFRCSRRR